VTVADAAAALTAAGDKIDPSNVSRYLARFPELPQEKHGKFRFLDLAALVAHRGTNVLVSEKRVARELPDGPPPPQITAGLAGEVEDEADDEGGATPSGGSALNEANLQLKRLQIRDRELDLRVKEGSLDLGLGGRGSHHPDREDQHPAPGPVQLRRRVEYIASRSTGSTRTIPATRVTHQGRRPVGKSIRRPALGLLVDREQPEVLRHRPARPRRGRQVQRLQAPAADRRLADPEAPVRPVSTKDERGLEAPARSASSTAPRSCCSTSARPPSCR
jgi:hypothetical protein